VVDHPAIGSYDLSSMKRIITGASPSARPYSTGATAALPHVEFSRLRHDRIVADRNSAALKEHIGSGRDTRRHRGAGRATLGCEVRIVDPDDKPVPNARSARSSCAATT